MSNDEKMWGMLSHLSALVGLLGIPFGFILGPLVVYLIKRDEYSFVNTQGKESLNFQISILIYYAIAGVLCLILIGFVLLAIIFLFHIIYTVIASIKAHNGEHYHYPLTIRFLK
ncbi:orotate phosphoribosyltransferase [Lottiidibacillus patelloidae]|uniref:Orotate phosphoribosyltransferase n=2 Tax=Lottiidibacillus patelloidae TaxID=2670334 RepID=A0A263BS74_9BACI|nr:orotate phosphoribosyltransferase [Lottiidibacillus patelloidae]